MKFEDILPALKEGKKVKRKNWNKINYIRIGEEDLIVDENDECFPFILEDFLTDNWEIIKETKKVKLRDLTEEQYRQWVKRECYTKRCEDDCPFSACTCGLGSERSWLYQKDMYSDKFLDQEVEVEE